MQKIVKLVFLPDSQSLSSEDFETPEQPATESPLFLSYNLSE